MLSPFRTRVANLLVLLLAGASSLTAGDGVWTTTFPEGGDVYGPKLELDTGNPARLWVAPQWRGLYTSADGAASWSSLTDDQPVLPFNRTNVIVLLSDPTTGTLYLSDGNVYRSTDGGQSWSAAGSGISEYVVSLAINPSDPDVLYAGTAAGVLYKSTDGAATWSQVGAGTLPGNQIFDLAVDPTTPSTVYAGLENNGIWRSTDGGASWADWSNGTVLTSVFTIAIDPGNPLVIWLAAWAGGPDGVYKTIDGGANWVLLPPAVAFDGTTRRKIAIDPSDTDTVYVAGGEVFETNDGGIGWSSTAACGGRAASVVLDPVTPATLYAGCYQFGVHKSTDGNTTWAPANGGLQAIGFPHSKSHPLMIDPASTSDVYAGAAPGYKSSDGGATWGSLSLPEGWAGAFASGSIYAMGNTLYRSDDGGANWVDAIGGTLCCFQEGDVVTHPGDPMTVYFSGYGSGSAADGVYKTTDGGASWSPVNSGLASTQIRALAVDPSNGNTVYAGAREGGPSGLFRTSDGGANWFQLGGGLPADFHVDQILVHPQDSNVVLMAAEGSSAGIYRSDDGGGSWTQILAENTNAVAVNPNECCPPAQTIYAGTWNSGGFYRSLDGGQSWALVNDGLPLQPGIEAIQVDPADTDRVLIATTGGVWEHRFAGSVELMVTHPDDDGPGSLRQALLQAQQDGLPNRIRFHPGMAGSTLGPQTELPNLGSDPVDLDGDVNGDCVPDIAIDGSALVGIGGNGITVNSGGNRVAGLAIHSFDCPGCGGDGIAIYSGNGNLIECNYLGTDLGGVADLGIATNAIKLVAADGNTITRNRVVFNGTGVEVNDGSTANVVGPDNEIAWQDGNGIMVRDGIDEQYPLFTALVPDATTIFPGVIDFTDDGGSSPFHQVGGGPIVDGAGGTFHNTFGMRLTGTLNVSMGGIYTFTFERLDDSAHLWVDGSIDHEAAGQGDSVGGFLTLGGHDFTLAFREHPGAADLRLTISGPGSVTFTTDAGLGPCAGGQPGVCGELFHLRIASDGNTITENAIHDNGALGIRLGDDGLGPWGAHPNDPGDADVGPNTQLNFPEITNATDLGGGDFQLNGTAPPDSTVEVFARQPDPSGFGEGEVFLGAQVASGIGNWSRVVSLPPGFFSVTTTATDPAGNTSEFSGGVPILANALVVTNANDSGPGSLRDAIQQANGDGTSTDISFDPGMAGQVINLLSQLPDLTEDATTIDADLGADCIPDVELDGSLAGGGADGLAIVSAGNVIRGLAFVDFGQDGLKLAAGLAPGAGAGNVVECNSVGVHLDGSPGGNGRIGVWVGYLSNQGVGGASDNTIGPGNVIAHNGEDGIKASDGNVSPYPDFSGLGAADAVEVFPVLDFDDSDDRFFSSTDGITPTDVTGAPFSDDFGMRLSGTIGVVVPGTYTLSLSDLDDNAMILVGGVQIVPNEGDCCTGQAALSGATALEIRYQEGCGSARLAVDVSGPGSATFTTDGALGGACPPGLSGLCGELFRFRAAAEGNRITENRIFQNGGLGISLDRCGSNPIPSDPGDLDLGANTWLNHPEITSHVDLGGGSFDLAGTAPPNSTVELFAAAADPSGFGEGAEHLVTVPADGNGDWSALGVGIPADFFDLTATATDALGNTSEFGPTLRVKTPDAVDILDAAGYQGDEVLVPITVCDRAATPLGTDSGPGHRIQGVAFQVSLSPFAGVSGVVAEKAGIAAPFAPLFESSSLSGNTVTYLASYDEGASPLPFTLDADPPGCDVVAQLRVTLDPLAPPVPIALVATAASALSNQGGTVTEDEGVGTLELQGGTLTVLTRGATALSAFGTSATTVALRWTDPQVDELGFRVERSPDGASWASVATLNDPDATAHTDAGLPAATLFYYRVISFGPGGDNPPSNVAAASTFPAVPALACVQPVTALDHSWARFGDVTHGGGLWGSVRDERNGGTDSQVLFQFLSANGSPSGASVPISRTDMQSQFPSVVFNGTNYGIFWGEHMRGPLGVENTGTNFLTLLDGGGAPIRQRVRLFEADAPLGGLNTDAEWSFAWDGGGWVHAHPDLLDETTTDVFFWRWEENGERLAGPVNVSNTPGDIERDARLASSGVEQGIVWIREQAGVHQVLFQRLQLDGSPVAGDPAPVLIADNAGGEQLVYTDVVWNGAGWAVVFGTWLDDPDGTTIVSLRLLDAAGTPLGPAKQLSDTIDAQMAQQGQPGWPVYDEMPKLLFTGSGYLCFTSSWTGASSVYEVMVIAADAAGDRVEYAPGLARRAVSDLDGAWSLYERAAMANDGTSALVLYNDNRQGTLELASARVSPAGILLDGPHDVTGGHMPGNSQGFAGANNPLLGGLAGGFVSLWTDPVSGPVRIYARLFDPAGSPTASLTPLSGRGVVGTPGLAAVGESFAVAWKDNAQNLVFGRWDAAGNPIVGETEVATAVGGGANVDLAFSGEEYALLHLRAPSLTLLRVDPAGTPVGSPSVVSSSVWNFPPPQIEWVGSGWAVFWRGQDHDLHYSLVDPWGSVAVPDTKLTTSGGATGWFEPVWTGELLGLAWSEDRGLDPPGNELRFTILALDGTFAIPEVEVMNSYFGGTNPAFPYWQGDRFHLVRQAGTNVDGLFEDEILPDGTLIPNVRQLTNRSGSRSVAFDGATLGILWSQFRSELYFETTACLDDATPPSCPTPTAAVIDGEVRLDWTPAGDPESGIWRTDLYRDGVMLAELFPATSSYADEGAPLDAPALAYEVRAMNGAFTESVGCPVLVVSTIDGDATCDGFVTNADVLFLVDHLFAAGPAPICDGDANGDGQVTVGDIFYLVNFIHGGGPPPLLPDLLGAGDELRLATVPGSAGTVVSVPIRIRDVSGTALDEGNGPNGEIQGFGFRIDVSPPSDVVSLGFQQSGVTAGRAAIFPIVSIQPDHLVVLLSFDETAANLGFVLDSPVGDEIGRILVEVAPGTPEGSRIDLELWPTASLVAADARTEESVVNGGLQTFNGQVVVGSELLFADGFESGDTSAWNP